MEKKSAAQKIEERKIAKMKWLQDCCKQVIDVADRTLKKIENEGLAGNYSCNHDIQKWSERIHRTSYELWLLSDLSIVLSKEAADSKNEEVKISSSKNLKKSNRKKSKKDISKESK